MLCARCACGYLPVHEEGRPTSDQSYECCEAAEGRLSHLPLFTVGILDLQIFHKSLSAQKLRKFRLCLLADEGSGALHCADERHPQVPERMGGTFSKKSRRGGATLHARRPPVVVVTDERFSQTIGPSDAAVPISELASSDHTASAADGTNLADVGPSPAPASPPRAPGTNIAIHVDTEVADTTQPWTEPASSSRGTEEVSGQERTTDDEVSESPADGEVSTPKFVTRAIGRMSSAVSFDGLRKAGGWKKSGKKSVEILVHIDGSAMDNMQDCMMTQATVEGRWLNKSVRDAVLVGLLRHLNSGQPEERKLMMADVSNVMIQGVPASVDEPVSHYAPKDGQEPALMSVVLKKLPNSSVTVTWLTALLPLPFGFSFDRETNHILSILPESETERDGTLRAAMKSFQSTGCS